MKVVILAGGFGTRISEESHLKPKPMLEIGGKPILWHIMKTYISRGYDDFIICAGYKQNVIKEYFNNYFLYNSDVSFDFSDNGKMTTLHSSAEPFRVTIVDTGLNTMTGGRIKRIQKYLDDGPFLLTYGDGVTDLDISKVVDQHIKSCKKATITAVRPEGRFGIMDVQGEEVRSFREKSKDDTGWINGGYMVLNPEVIDYINGDSTVFEQEPLKQLCSEGQLAAYKHYGFWQCMDTLRDKQNLEKMWESGNAPWKTW